jgi:predicted ferric reductase
LRFKKLTEIPRLVSPLISILSTLHQTSSMPPKVEFLYSTKVSHQKLDANRILFLPRLCSIQSSWPKNIDLTLFITGDFKRMRNPEELPWHYTRRIEKPDLLTSLGEDVEQRKRTVCYVCGPPRMTDEFVEFLAGQEGMEAERVFCEKWW